MELMPPVVSLDRKLDLLDFDFDLQPFFGMVGEYYFLLL